MASIFKKIGSFFKSVTKSSAGEELVEIVVSNSQKAVAALKATEAGSIAANAIKSLANRSELSSAQKFATAVSAVLPAVALIASKEGRNVAASEVESIARALVQEVFNDIQSSNAGVIAKLLLSILKVR